MPTEMGVDRDAEARLRRACAELERRLLAGESTCAEQFLAADPELFVDADAALELVYAEFVIRVELNQKPDPTAWYSRFPQWQARLQRLFEVHHLVATPLLRSPADRTGEPAANLAGRWDSYELLEKIGQGGMGVVYRARQVALNRIVALKLIRAGVHADDIELARFRAEGEAAARLQHVNIVQIHEVGEQDGQPYLSLEFVDGGSLARRLAGRPLPAREAAQLVETLARAVHYAHQRGIVHRDLKPANILLHSKSEIPNPKSETKTKDHTSPSDSDFGFRISDFEPKIADFGLATHLESGTRLTRTGACIGTPSYMAPEQTEGRAGVINVMTDVYGLGAILYEALTGRPPFCGTSELDTLKQVRSAEPTSPVSLQPTLSRDLETICLKCLHKEPGRRYPTAEELADDLRRFLAGEPIRARPIGRLERVMKWARRRPAVAALLVALVAVVVVAFTAVTLLWRGAEQARADLLEQQQQTETALFDRQVLLARREWETLHFHQARQMLAECAPERRDREWRYLHHVLHAKVQTYDANCPFHDAIYHPSGRWLAVASFRDVVVLDAASGRVVFSRPGNVFHVAFQGASDRLVAYGQWAPDRKSPRSREIVVWNITTGVREGGFVDAEEGWRDNTSLSPRGEVLMRRGRGAQTVLEVHDPLTGKVLHDLGPSGTMALPALSDNGARFATLDGTRTVAGDVARIVAWDLSASKLQSMIPLPVKVDCVAALAVSGAGDRLALAYRHVENGYTALSKVAVFDVVRGEQLLTFPVQRENVNRLVFSPDGLRLASGAQDGTVVLWDVVTGKELLTFREESRAIFPAAFSPDGRRLAGADSRKLYVWDVDPPRETER